MPKTNRPHTRRFDIVQLGKRAAALREDGALAEQFAKLEILFGCTRQRVVEILAADAIARYYEPVLEEAMEIIKLNPDGSVIDADMVRRYLVNEYGINEEAAAEIEARAARKLRWRLVKNQEKRTMKFKVLTDSSYTGGLSFLNRFEDVITEPDAEFDENGNEYYTITSERTDIRSLLDDCDAVISYEEVKK